MFFQKAVLFLYFLFRCQTNGQDILDTPIGELPTAIAEDIIKILTNSLTLIGQCGPPEIGSFNLLLHTRSNPDNPIVLNLTNPVEIQNGKKTILLIHGYLSSSNLTSLQTMKTKYLIRYDCNVLLLDWSEITYAIYTSPYCQIPLVADFLADFFCLLDGNYSISVGGLHLVGHSLGAQMSGFIGQLTKTKCNKTVGRITGLDPAGPLYSGAPISQRLDAGDAVFVDVVHTNEGIFGYTGNCGDIDFDANCGTQQPGCPVINLSQIADTLGSVVTCSHSRSHELFAESITSDGFVGRHCFLCFFPYVCNNRYAIMGEDAVDNPYEDTFWLPTKATAPFARGCSPFPPSCP